MNVGVIGYGSMGKMLADKFIASGERDGHGLRTCQLYARLYCINI